MSNRVKGTLFGITASLIGLIIWVVCGAFLSLIAGWAGAIMGLAFILVYRKFNPSDKSSYQIIVAICLIIVEIIVAEMITIGIVVSINDVDLAYALTIKDFQNAIVVDLIIGYVLSFLVFVLYMFSSRKKENRGAEQKRITTDIDLNINHEANQNANPETNILQTNETLATDISDENKDNASVDNNNTLK